MNVEGAQLTGAIHSHTHYFTLLTDFVYICNTSRLISH